MYTKRDRTRLKLSLRGKRLGLSLVEIRELIDMYDNQPDESSQLQKVIDVLRLRRAVLEQQREDIEEVLAELGDFEQQCQQILDQRQGG